MLRRSYSSFARALNRQHLIPQNAGRRRFQSGGPIPNEVTSSSGGLLDKFVSVFDRERSEAPDGYNRWLTVPSVFAIQTSIGSVYAWSIFNGPLTREIGMVASSAQDWGLSEVVPIFSTCALSLGLTTWFLGSWAERSGPRKVAAAAAASWAGGLVMASLGCSTHCLPLVYAGYGLLGGVGWGLGYMSPVSTLMKWFPDRRGLGAGIGLTAFGGGAIWATPISEALLRYHAVAPEYLGATDAVDLVTREGRRFVESTSGALQEVVVATSADLARIGMADTLADGVYLVGTGSAGVSATFLTLSAAHFAMMMTGALTIKVPQPGWQPEGWTPPETTTITPTQEISPDKTTAPKNPLINTHGDVTVASALRTPQFYLLWLSVFGNACAGVSVISCAKTLMTDVFATHAPAIVTGSFAAGYVAALSASNMAGRLGWAAASDYLTRKRTYMVFGALGIPAALSVPTLTDIVAQGGDSLLPLVAFYGGTCAVVSFYGGLFSVLPPYLADIFGSKHVGAHHGKMLTAWSASALCGPMILTKLRSDSYSQAVTDLATKIDPSRFEAAFGAPKIQLQSLIDAKSVTIARLMEIAPAGTLDPTPAIYDSTMYAMGGLMCVAALSNLAMRPVDKKFCTPKTIDVSYEEKPAQNSAPKSNPQ